MRNNLLLKDEKDNNTTLKFFYVFTAYSGYAGQWKYFDLIATEIDTRQFSIFIDL